MLVLDAAESLKSTVNIGAKVQLIVAALNVRFTVAIGIKVICRKTIPAARRLITDIQPQATLNVAPRNVNS